LLFGPSDALGLGGDGGPSALGWRWSRWVGAAGHFDAGCWMLVIGDR